MNTIRPGFPAPPQPTSTPRPDAARLAAQKAFFAVATGQAAPSAQPAAAAPAIAPTRASPISPSRPVAAPAVTKIPTPGAEPPARILRPGSLLDIRV